MSQCSSAIAEESQTHTVWGGKYVHLLQIKYSQLSYIALHFLFASAKYLLAQNCTAPSGTVFFVGFCQNEAKQDEHLARRDWAKDAKNTRRRAYEVWFSSAIVFTDFKKQNKAKNADLFTSTKFYVIMVIMKERAL